MTALRIAFNELFGLFVDDGNLALFAVTLVAGVTAIVKLLGVPPLWGGILLLLGCLAILAESVAGPRRGGKIDGNERSRT